MAITCPIPDAARSIVEAIRATVQKPDPGEFTHTHGNCFRHVCNDECPMGMLPNALLEAPERPEHFRECQFSKDEIKSFFNWWDDQRDIEAAVQAVWGDK